jgi:hypothetical protein
MTAALVPASRRRKAGAGPFSVTVVVWVVLIGVVAFIGSLILAAFGQEWQSGDNGQTHALSKSAIGFAGEVQLQRSLGRTVEISRTERPERRDRSLMVLTPTPTMDAKALKTVQFKGPILVVLPKWNSSSDLRRGWVRGRSVYSPNESVDPIRDAAAPPVLRLAPGRSSHRLTWADGSPLGVTGPIEGFRTLSGGEWKPVVLDANGGMVLARYEGVLVLSDPDLLNTQGIADLANARTGVVVLDAARAGDGPIVFDVSLHGIKQDRNLLQLIFTPPFLGVTLALGLCALLLALQAIGRFGPPVQAARSFALGKQALADNSAALIRLARREHRMIERYALHARGLAARAVGAPHGVDEESLEALLDRLSVQAGLTPFTELRRDAAAAHDLGSALGAARRLYIWRLEMTRERH